MAHRWRTEDRTSPAALDRKAKYNSAEHRAARKHYAAWIASGHGRCWRCGGRIGPGEPFHVGHSDDGTQIMGAEHPAHNLRAAARKGNRAQKAAKRAAAFVRPLR